MQAQVFNLTLSPEQAQAALSALEHEVEACVKADLRDRQSFGFGPVIHEDSARDRAYLQQRKFAAESLLLAMQEAGVPYAEVSLRRAREAYDRIWAVMRREMEEKALHARLDASRELRDALTHATLEVERVAVGKTAKAYGSYLGLVADMQAANRKAIHEVHGWASGVRDLASRARSVGQALPIKSAGPVYRAGLDLEMAVDLARRNAKAVA